MAPADVIRCCARWAPGAAAFGRALLAYWPLAATRQVRKSAC